MPKSGFIFDGISKTYLHHSDIQYVQAWGLVVQWSAHQLWCPRSWVQTRPHPQRLKCALALCQFGSLNEATTFFFFCNYVQACHYVQVCPSICRYVPSTSLEIPTKFWLHSNSQLAENRHVMCVVEKAWFEPRTLGTVAEHATNCATTQVHTTSEIHAHSVTYLHRSVQVLCYRVDGSASTHKAVQSFENLLVTQIVSLNITAVIS